MGTDLLKVLVTGPVGSGKSTFIRTLAQSEVVDTDVLTSEPIGKAKTTVALDHGVLDLDGYKLHLFGTPGQDRFNFMWEVLAQGALGALLLVPAHSPRRIAESKDILAFIASRFEIPLVVGVTHLDQPKGWGVQEIASFLGVEFGRVVGVDPRDSQSAVLPLIHLLELIGTEGGGYV